MVAAESEDTLMPGGMRVVQSRKGYRYSIDTVLLARFAHARVRDRIVDLGTGAGILPLLLSHLCETQSLWGIELQPALAERARGNVEKNNLMDRIRIVEGDVRAIRTLLPENCADLVVSNPPYRAAVSGRVAPDPERAVARHELFGGLPDFVSAAAWLLPQGGRMAMVYLAERLSHLLATMTTAGIEPKRLRMVHPHRDDPARVVLVEGVNGARPGMQIENPLIIYRDRCAERRFTDEVERMYESKGGVGA